MSQSYYSPRVATAVIIANMIGTGVFTSLGFQLLGLQSGFVLILLWVVGGLTAFCGAMCYAELGARLPRSGGEYNFLTEAIHPSLGFTSGWISATIGFAAPTALVAITFGKYLHLAIPAVPATASACMLVVLLATIHASNHQRSGSAQFFFTVIKIFMVISFCVLALICVPTPQPVRFLPVPGDTQQIFSSAFAVSLIYVSYSYSGWNAATYFSGELEQPQRSLPRILAFGALIVSALYVLINVTFLVIAPADAMRGQLEIVYIAAEYAFGNSVAILVSAGLALLLVSTASAMLLAAPRVLQVIGQDFKAFRFLAMTNSNGIPHVAIYTQALIALLLIVTSSFESILVFSGFTLAINTFVTVVGLFVLRFKRPHEAIPFSAWGYPLTPILFLLLTGWIIVHIAIERSHEAIYGAGIIILGFVTYMIVRNR